VTLEQLKMLVYVAEQGSLKSASEVLHKTQPAISQGIKQLETLLGLPLFDRQGYRLVLTCNGQQIYQHALRLLSEADQIKQLAQFLTQGNEASITLAIEASYDLKKILPLLEMTQSEFPHTQIILQQEYISGAFEAVLSGQADLAVTTLTSSSMHSTHLDVNHLYQGYLTNVAAPRFLARHPKLKVVDELRDEYQIVVQDSGQNTKGVSYSVQTGQRCWYVNDFSSKRDLIISGMGWGRLPEHLIQDDLANNRLARISLDDFVTKTALNYHAIKLKSRLLGPVASKLWQDLELVHSR